MIDGLHTRDDAPDPSSPNHPAWRDAIAALAEGFLTPAERDAVLFAGLASAPHFGVTPTDDYLASLIGHVTAARAASALLDAALDGDVAFALVDGELVFKLTTAGERKGRAIAAALGLPPIAAADPAAELDRRSGYTDLTSDAAGDPA